ncbi:MAG: GNAT family N-acetyltransferase [Acetobacteraceae bacterium]
MEFVLAGEATEIVAVDHADPGLLGAIVRPLADFNAAFAGAPGFRPFLLALRAVPDGSVLGGLAGEVVYGWLSIQALFVPARLRRQGIGARLLGRAEAEARQRGLSGMVVNTFSFQARPFYERMGFAHFGTLEDCPPGYRCFYLSKRFNP